MKITKEDFVKHVEIIKYYHELDSTLSSLLKVDGVVCNSDKAIDSIISLLRILTDDIDDDIGFFCWECNFGTENDYMWDKDENLIPLKNSEDLYNYLKSVYNQ